VRLTFSLDSNLETIIKEYAVRWNCDKSTVIRTLILDGINHERQQRLLYEANSGERAR